MSAWDDRCLRCGRCCFEKIEHEDRIYYTDVPCEHLDLETRLCRIFYDRLQLKPECMPLDEETLERGILPQDCPYVAGRPAYNAPRLFDEEG